MTRKASQHCDLVNRFVRIMQITAHGLHTDPAAVPQKLRSHSANTFPTTAVRGQKTKNVLALPAAFGLCNDTEFHLSVALLDRKREDEYIADVGIAGAIFAPRVFADYGYENTTFRIFTQEKFPGWCKWIHNGETTLLENFAGLCSHSHVMFGDLAARMCARRVRTFVYASGLPRSCSETGIYRALHSMNVQRLNLRLYFRFLKPHPA